MPRITATTKREELNYAKALNYFVSQYCREHKISRSNLADTLDVFPGTLSLYCSGQRMPRAETAARLAAFFGTTVETMKQDSRAVPPDDTWEALPLYVDLAKKQTQGVVYCHDAVSNYMSTRFAVVADSVPDWISDTYDILICKESKTVARNKIFIINYQGQLYCRRYRKVQGLYQLTDPNEKRPPLQLTPGEIEELEVLGQVIELRRTF